MRSVSRRRLPRFSRPEQRICSHLYHGTRLGLGLGCSKLRTQLFLATFPQAPAEEAQELSHCMLVSFIGTVDPTNVVIAICGSIAVSEAMNQMPRLPSRQSVVRYSYHVPRWHGNHNLGHRLRALFERIPTKDLSAVESGTVTCLIKVVPKKSPR